MNEKFGPAANGRFTTTFPFDTAPRYLLRDRDDIYGAQFRSRVRSFGIEEVLTAPRSPWQRPVSLRRIS